MPDFAENVTAVMMADKNKRVSLHWASVFLPLMGETKKIKRNLLLIERRSLFFTSHYHGSKSFG